MVSKLKTAFVLVVIGAISGFLIWSVYMLSNEGILLNREIREQGFYKQIFNLDEDSDISFTKEQFADLEEVTLYDQENQVIGYIYKMSDANAYGNIVILVGIDPNQVVKNVVISASTNTPTYVKAVRDDNLPNLSDQFIDTLDYDDTTSATFTYNSVKKVVDAAVKQYLENRGAE